MSWSCSLLQARRELMAGMAPTPAVTVTQGPAPCPVCAHFSFTPKSLPGGPTKGSVPCLSFGKGNVSTGETGTRAGSFYQCLLGAISLVWRKKIYKKHLTLLFSIQLSPNVCLFALNPNTRASKPFPGMKQLVLHPNQDRTFYLNDKIFLLPPVFF